MEGRVSKHDSPEGTKSEGFRQTNPADDNEESKKRSFSPRKNQHNFLKRKSYWYVPLALKEWFTNLGLTNVHEMGWWDKTTWKDINIYSVPARHFSGRGPFDRNRTLWSGWVIEFPRFKFYFVGDTGYCDDFKTIGNRLGPMDLSAIPIGAYDPRWFMSPIHVDPEQAVLIHQDVQSRHSVAMHWGTFDLTLEDMDEPPIRLRRKLREEGIPDECFFVLKHGQTRWLDFLEKEAVFNR